MVISEHSRILFLKKETAALLPYSPVKATLADDEIEGHTIVSIISSGTEAALYRQDRDSPLNPGYAAVFQVSKIGGKVDDIAPGDLVFCMEPHQSFQRIKRNMGLPLPVGLAPETALFARMANMAMNALATTSARPPQLVFINGLGLIGHLTAQIFHKCGYTVYASDSSLDRCEIAKKAGIAQVFAEIPFNYPSISGLVSLFIDCTGKEQDVIAGCRLVHRNGEVILIGVPWSQRSELSAHELVSLIFHNYVRLRSGWEWELPTHPRHPGELSIYGNLEAALLWLAQGHLQTEGLYEIVHPRNADQVYGSIIQRTRSKISSIFNWRESM